MRNAFLNFRKENEITHICNLLPFLSRKFIVDIISKYEGLFCLDDIIQIAPFSNEEIMEILLKKMDINGGLENLIVGLVKQGYLKEYGMLVIPDLKLSDTMEY